MCSKINHKLPSYWADESAGVPLTDKFSFPTISRAILEATSAWYKNSAISSAADGPNTQNTALLHALLAVKQGTGTHTQTYTPV